MKKSFILIKGGTVHPIIGEVRIADILVEDGKIAKIEDSISSPKGAELVDAKGLHVFPGFVDAHCHIGLWEEGTGQPGSDGNEATDPITPQVRAIDAINPRDEAFDNAVKGGITCVCTTPGSANVLGGIPVVIKTYGNRADKMVVDPYPAVKCAFGENPKRFYGSDDKMPSTRMGIAALLREMLFKTKDYMDAKKSKDGGDFDMKLEALIPVMEKKIPLKAHCHRADDIFTAIRIAKEFDLKMTLDHCTEAHLIADELKEETYPIIIGPTFGEKSKVELREKSFETPRVLFENGISVSIMTDAPVIPIENLPMCAALASKAGLPHEEALKCITINPAKTLGLEDRIGSIEIGKDADIVIWDRENPLDIYAETKYVFINGKLVSKDGVNL